MLLFFAFFIVSSYGEALQGTSYFTDHPPSADGIISIGEWNNASKMKLEHGFVTYTEREYGYLMAQNDAKNLYILFDVLEDTSENASLAEKSWPDYFWLSFDVDLDKRITPNVDVLFSHFPSNRSVLGKAFHLSPGGTSGMTNTASQLGTGFGSSLNSETPHRFWEIAIDLQEINSEPYLSVAIGYRVHSDVPLFTREFPYNYIEDFSNLFEIKLGVIYEPELPKEPEEPEPFIENIKLGSIELISLFAILVIIILIFVSLWAKKRNNDLQSGYKPLKRNFRRK